MRSYLLTLWNIIDPIYFSCTRLRYVPDVAKKNTVLRVRLTRYKGVNAVLQDGTEINKNDVLLKIHLHNVRMITELQKMENEVQKAIYVYRNIKDSLAKLANFVIEENQYQEFKAIIGITNLYQGANRLGFEVIPIKNPYYRMFKQMTFMPINVLANASVPKKPAYLFMSKQQLMEKYL